MEATIRINMDNEAFEENESLELARILRELIEEIEDKDALKRNLFDINGNKVGTFEIV